MPVKEENTIENPETSTAGFASTTQLTNTTESIAVIISNTSSTVSTESLFIPFKEREETRSKDRGHKTKHAIFRESLRKAMHVNAETLKELARY